MKHYVITGIQDSYYGFARPLMSYSSKESAEIVLDTLNELIKDMEKQAGEYSSTVPITWLKKQEAFNLLLCVEPNFLLGNGHSYHKDPKLAEKEEVFVPEPYELIEVEFAG